jgi:hypothetical protein
LAEGNDNQDDDNQDNDSGEFATESAMMGAASSLRIDKVDKESDGKDNSKQEVDPIANR